MHVQCFYRRWPKGTVAGKRHLAAALLRLVILIPLFVTSTISSEHSASFYLLTCQDMTQSVLTEEWVLGPEGTPFYTKRVRMLFPISPPFFFSLVN